LAALLGWSGCSLSDDYFVDQNYGHAGNGALHSGGRETIPGGFGGIKLGSGGSAGQAGSGSDAGSSAAVCSAENCGARCCGDRCVDLMTDLANCGSCGLVCSARRTCQAGSCSDGWITMAAPPSGFVARERAAAAVFDGKLFIFGGLDGNGVALEDAAVYDPRSDSWEEASPAPAALTPRQLSSAVWTTSHGLFIFGGTNANETTYFADGALYNPVSGLWTPLSGPSLTPRAAATVAAAGNAVVVAGGLTTGRGAASGVDQYDLTGGAWQQVSSLNGPGPLLYATWVFSDQELLVYGGLINMTRTNSAFLYSLPNSSWTPLLPGPTARSGAFGAWDGSKFYIWGGQDSAVRNDGSTFDGQNWVAMPSPPPPVGVWPPPPGSPGRRVLPRQSGWAFALNTDDVVFLGGADTAGNFLKDGRRYQQSNGWSEVPAWPSGETHSWGVAALVGGEVILWGGHESGGVTSTGERYRP
jgi:hypothetical protein